MPLSGLDIAEPCSVRDVARDNLSTYLITHLPTAMQAEAEEEAEAEQCGLKQQLHDMRSELRELRASCATAEREVGPQSLA